MPTIKLAVPRDVVINDGSSLSVEHSVYVYQSGIHAICGTCLLKKADFKFHGLHYCHRHCPCLKCEKAR